MDFKLEISWIDKDRQSVFINNSPFVGTIIQIKQIAAVYHWGIGILFDLLFEVHGDPCFSTRKFQFGRDVLMGIDFREVFRKKLMITITDTYIHFQDVPADEEVLTLDRILKISQKNAEILNEESKLEKLNRRIEKLKTELEELRASEPGAVLEGE